MPDADETTPADIGIIVGVYVGVIIAVTVFASTTEMGARIFGVYSNSLMRVAALLSLLTTVGALALYYIELGSVVFVGGMVAAALFSVLYFFVTRNKSDDPDRRLDWDNALTVVAQLLVLLLPVSLSLWQREDMTPTVSWVVVIFTGAFWLFGLLSYYLKRGYAQQIKPFGKTVTLLILLSVSYWMTLFSAGWYAVPIVLLVSFVSFLVLTLHRSDRLLSLSLASHQKHPAISAFLVATVIYGTVLCLVMSLTKDQQDRDDGVFALTVLLGVIGILWFFGIIAFEAIRHYNRPGGGGKGKAAAAPPSGEVDARSLDVFASASAPRTRKQR